MERTAGTAGRDSIGSDLPRLFLSAGADPPNRHPRGIKAQKRRRADLRFPIIFRIRIVFILIKAQKQGI